nr:hypothetical protein [Arenimonas daejeonensis]
MFMVEGYVLGVALTEKAVGKSASRKDVHGADTGPGSAAAAPAVRAPASAQTFDRPVFIVSPPRSGSTLLFETLLAAPGLYTIGDESHSLIEGVPGLAPSQRQYDSNRLLAADADPRIAAQLRQRFLDALRDRDGKAPTADRLRMLEKTPKRPAHSLPARSIPGGAFHLPAPRPAPGAGQHDRWLAVGRIRHVSEPAGLERSALVLPADARLAGAVGPAAGPDRGGAVGNHDPAAARRPGRPARRRLDHGGSRPVPGVPQAEVERLCAWAGWSWDRALGAALPLSRYTLTAPDPEKWRRHAALIEPELPGLQATLARAARAAQR